MKNRRQKIRYSSLAVILGASLVTFALKMNQGVSADTTTSSTSASTSYLLFLGLAGVALLVSGAIVLVVALAKKEY